MLPLYTMPVLTTGVKSIAHFLRDFVDYKGYDKVNLLGNSLGGHVALIFCKEHPERVNSLTLTASSGLYENAFGSSFPRREDKEFIRQKVGLTFYDPKHANKFNGIKPSIDESLHDLRMGFHKFTSYH